MKKYIINKNIYNIKIENEMNKFEIIINIIKYNIFINYLIFEKFDFIII